MTPRLRYERFYDPRLSVFANKICEMARNGMDYGDIAEEMEITRCYVRATISKSRKRGAAIPFAARGPNGYLTVPLRRLLEIRQQLRDTGASCVNSIIAERTGLTRNNVNVRLWLHDQREKKRGLQNDDGIAAVNRASKRGSAAGAVGRARPTDPAPEVGDRPLDGYRPNQHRAA